MKAFHKPILVAVTMATIGVPPVLAEDRILPVPTVTIYPGDIIDAAMLKDRLYPDTYRFRTAVIESPRVLIGKTVRRTLIPGEAIPMNSVDDPKVVTRGVPTTVVFEEAGLSITGVGTPLQSGIVGQSIQVKNIDSGRIIIGRVEADGKIRIGGY
ncbi:flagellar basal body P-ring formation chaperone FlgA [Microvirga brassicacearum]|uniref:Flagella basal body P-ring formation protein FlgA n=1 Tax=Microvirga brassicacearum TaxID=2580413 RepID=A0A5N3P3X1_9HYPH|nr:flagellar basal body P-ring formation chaperone FlgA [Microvirga brassicacearum]KAB0264341.1 flagellar basal body P-ring formation protein FlgA [Microvirga brassicacearum]